MKKRPFNGTQKGDVYSFAIIVQEIAYRAQPYFCDNIDPRGLCASFDCKIGRFTEGKVKLATSNKENETQQRDLVERIDGKLRVWSAGAGL
jgi:hypothetical protein